LKEPSVAEEPVAEAREEPVALSKR
jgi:hypothetical protein